MREAFDRRRHAIVSALNELPGVSCEMPRGLSMLSLILQVCSVNRSVRTERFVKNTVQLAALILDEVHVAAVPGEGFSAPGYIRFPYALADDDLAEGMHRLKEWLA